MIFLISFFSFIFEYFFNILFHGSIFTGLIVFSSMVLLEPYFKKNKDKYFVFCFLLGLVYDIVYTGTYFMNAGIFLIIGCIVIYIDSVTPNNLFVSILELLFLIVLYRFLCFLFLFLNGVIGFDLFLFFRSIYSSIILNIIYGVCLYFILIFISSKFKIKRIN